MKRLALTFAFLSLLSLPAYANHTEGHASENLHTITVNVNGLVCDFCARAIEKVFYQQSGVEGVEVNLDNHYVKLDVTDEASLNDEKITELITDAGYNVVDIKRGD